MIELFRINATHIDTGGGGAAADNDDEFWVNASAYYYTVISKEAALQATQLGMSLMYARNKMGPKSELCGTPDVTGATCDVSLSPRLVECDPTRSYRS